MSFMTNLVILGEINDPIFMTDGPHFFLQTYRDGHRWVFNDSVLLWTNGKRENAHPDRAPLPCKFSSKQ